MTDLRAERDEIERRIAQIDTALDLLENLLCPASFG